MAEVNTPINANNPNVSIPQKGNVASLTNPSTLSNLNNSTPPITFGDQVKKAAVAEVIKAATQSKLATLYKEKASLVREGIKLDVDHQSALSQIELKHTPKKQIQNGQTVEIPAEYDDTEYQLAINNENKNYEEAQINLQERKVKNQNDIDEIIKDPFKKQKDAKKKRQKRKEQKKKRTKEEKTKAKKTKTNAVLKNAKKSIVPVLTLLLTNKVAEVIAQNGKLKKLVDDTNSIITEANDSGIPTKLQNAKLARDNAIRIIQNSENKILRIKNDISRISTYITIFSVIITIISAIPIPTAVPPGIGIPINLIIKFVKILDKANRILLSLSALIPILLSVLEKSISILEDYKTQLLDINGQLEKATANDNTNASGLLNNGENIGANGIQTGTLEEIYKGFRFAIREDNSFGGVHVGQFKRHYAVAIDQYNVEVLKSELSFTLDPDDLVSQLKLVIDEQGLYTGDGKSQNLKAGNSDNDVMDFMKANSPENVGSINSLVNDAQKQQKLQQQLEEKKRFEVLDKRVKKLINTERPPLTQQQKAYYTAVLLDPTKLLYERENARKILDRNYV